MRNEKKNETAFKLKSKIIIFGSSNIHKFNEACTITAKYDLSVGMLKVKTIEIQSGNLSEIASTSASEAFKRCHMPIMVEDAGLFVDALNGFPGPYAAYAYQTLGNAGLLKLMENIQKRRAVFRSVVAYCVSESEPPKLFEGEVVGTITSQERKAVDKPAFGFDPVFQPVGSQKTFAEMSLEEKNSFSHRAQALRKFADWYKKGL